MELGIGKQILFFINTPVSQYVIDFFTLLNCCTNTPYHGMIYNSQHLYVIDIYLCM